MRNKELLLEKGLAFNLDNKEDIAFLVSKCINDGFNKKIWGKRARELSRPNASKEIVHKIVEMTRKNKLWKQ